MERIYAPAGFSRNHATNQEPRMSLESSFENGCQPRSLIAAAISTRLDAPLQMRNRHTWPSPNQTADTKNRRPAEPHLWRSCSLTFVTSTTMTREYSTTTTTHAFVTSTTMTLEYSTTTTTQPQLHTQTCVTTALGLAKPDSIPGQHETTHWQETYLDVLDALGTQLQCQHLTCARHLLRHEVHLHQITSTLIYSDRTPDSREVCFQL